MKDKTIRNERKWAKISGFSGRFVVAFGWAGEIACRNKQIYPTRMGALFAAENWIAD